MWLLLVVWFNGANLQSSTTSQLIHHEFVNSYNECKKAADNLNNGSHNIDAQCINVNS